MNKRLNYQITPFEEGCTVERFLRKKGFSRHLLVHLRRTKDSVTVDQKPVPTTKKLLTGESLSVLLPEENASQNIVPTQMDLNIVYEDEDLLVVNKPAGIPVHPSQGHYEHTLANGLAWYFAEKNEPFVFRAINRLDRDTTGLLIVARHLLSAAILSAMVKDKKIRREYLAVAEGKTPENGSICQPIARVDGSTIERCADSVRGEFALTHYKRIFYDEKTGFSLLLLTLETGRTHQIRVHMKYIGHPLPGDFLYNPDYRYINRQALHSYRLFLEHPITGQSLSFTAPMPEDFYFLSPFG